MSTTRAIAQIPRGQGRFVVNTGNDTYGDMFLESDFDEWYNNYSSVVQKLGKFSYLVVGADFSDTVRNNIPHVLGSRFLQDNGYNHFTLIDMGAEITIGTPVNPRILVFRKVKLPADSDDFGNARVGYVVTENNADDLDRPRLACVVARS